MTGAGAAVLTSVGMTGAGIGGDCVDATLAGVGIGGVCSAATLAGVGIGGDCVDAVLAAVGIGGIGGDSTLAAAVTKGDDTFGLVFAAFFQAIKRQTKNNIRLV